MFSCSDTAVWRDPWIPVCPPWPPSSNQVYKDPHLLIYHLIDHRTKMWKEDMLQHLFQEEDIRWIKCIKPSRIHQADRYVWAFSKSGNYTVKTGYAVAVQLKDSEVPQQLLEPSNTALKFGVWSLKTTRRIKHFLWQSLAGAVPTRQGLTDRHCGSDRSCPRCSAAEESINHLLFDCPAAKQVWDKSYIPSIPGVFPSDSLLQNFDHLLWRAKAMQTSEKILASFPWIIWNIWKARNAKVFEDYNIPATETLQTAISETEEWNVAQILETDGREDILQRNTEEDGELETKVLLPRCQVDASWVSDSQFCGGGLVLEKENGEILFGSTATFRVLSPLHAELAALVWAMKATLHLGINSMKFEMDCMQLVKLTEEEEIWPSMASELEEFFLISNCFTFCSVSFIPRLLNVRSDKLSKGARARGLIFSYVNSMIPSWLALEVD